MTNGKLKLRSGEFDISHWDTTKMEKRIPVREAILDSVNEYLKNIFSENMSMDFDIAYRCDADPLDICIFFDLWGDNPPSYITNLGDVIDNIALVQIYEGSELSAEKIASALEEKAAELRERYKES